MSDIPSVPTQGQTQVHAPLKAWFESKAAEPAPEHLIALVDQLEAAESRLVKKAS